MSQIRYRFASRRCLRVSRNGVLRQVPLAAGLAAIVVGLLAVPEFARAQTYLTGPAIDIAVANQTYTQNGPAPDTGNGTTCYWNKIPTPNASNVSLLNSSSASTAHIVRSRVWSPASTPNGDNSNALLNTFTANNGGRQYYVFGGRGSRPV